VLSLFHSDLAFRGATWEETEEEEDFKEVESDTVSKVANAVSLM
jgi:hypothetical protein